MDAGRVVDNVTDFSPSLGLPLASVTCTGREFSVSECRQGSTSTLSPNHPSVCGDPIGRNIASVECRVAQVLMSWFCGICHSASQATG